MKSPDGVYYRLECDIFCLEITSNLKDSLQDSGHSNFSYARCAEKRFTQIYRDLYGDAMLVPIRMGTNMAAGNQQKHLSLSFTTKA